MNSAGATPLLQAAVQGHVEIVSMLLGRGAAIDAVGKDNLTALMAAAYGGRRDVVTVLPRHDVVIASKDTSGRTAIDYATEAGNRIAKLLEDALQAEK